MFDFGSCWLEAKALLFFLSSTRGWGQHFLCRINSGRISSAVPFVPLCSMVFQPSVPAQSVSEGSYVSYNNAVVFHGVP